MTTRARWWGVSAGAIALASVATQLTQSWVPLDEGTIALAARYVGLGFLPHRDFAYPYTGGLAVWDALAMRVFGDTMAAPRTALFLAFAAWIPAFWALARRFVGPVGAATTLVLAAWWSLYVYPAAMPTWYLLFLATWLVFALIRWRAAPRARWLVLAGVLCGTAIAIKQTGLYLVLAALVGVLAYDQDAPSSAAEGSAPAASRRIRWAAVTALLAALAALPILIVLRRGFASGETLVIVLPAFAVIAGLFVRERRLYRSGDVPRANPLIRAWGVVLAGAAIPVGALVAWYAAHGAAGALIDGAFLRGLNTAATINRAAPPAATIVVSGVIAFALAGLLARPQRLFWRFFGGSLVAFALCVGAMYSVAAYHMTWHAAQLLVPIGVVLAVMVAARGHASARDRAAGGDLLVLAAAVVSVALNQFPYAAPNYFAYVAPLAMLLVGLVVGLARRGVLRALPPMRFVAHAVRTPFLVVLFLLFGGWFHRIGSVQTVGEGSVWWDDAHALPGPHAGLTATRSDSAKHERLLDLIRAHGGPDRFVAGPELPQLYVLAGTTRLVGQPFLLAPGLDADTAAFARALDPSAIDLVAINDAPLFLAAPSPAVRAWIAARFRNVERVEDVEVRWR